MADFLSMDIEGYFDDDREVLLPIYARNQIEQRPLPEVNWSVKESTSIEERTSRVVKNSRIFLNLKRIQKEAIPVVEPPIVQSSQPSSSKPKPRMKAMCHPPESLKIG